MTPNVSYGGLLLLSPLSLLGKLLLAPAGEFSELLVRLTSGLSVIFIADVTGEMMFF